MTDLTNIKAGDTVYVVWQRSRRHKGPAKQSEETVLRVGRKYGYINPYGDEEPFHLSTGASHHDAESNARCNGFGFDVYRSKDEYEKEQHNEREFLRLQERLVERHGRLVRLPLEAVQMIHEVLDNSDWGDE